LPASRAACVPGIHGDADIRLRQCRGIVGAVAAHGDELALGLLVTDELKFVLRCRLGKEVIDAGLRRNRGRCGSDCRR